MSKDHERLGAVASGLHKLLGKSQVSQPDRTLAERCLRRIEQPLRLTVFGCDPNHAISLANLMVGQVIVPPTIHRARVKLKYSTDPYVRLQLPDGSQRRIEGLAGGELFEANASHIWICRDLPVLRKISIQIATDRNPNLLCSDAARTLASADIAVWSGDELSAPLANVWKGVPDRLRDHSYLVLAPHMSRGSWKTIDHEFVEVLQVDPRRAQKAKDCAGGVDKVAFRESGGTQLVKVIKNEIELLVQSALDAGDLLLLRYAEQLAETDNIFNEVSANLSTEPEGDVEIWEKNPSESLSVSEYGTRSPTDCDVLPENRFDRLPSGPRVQEDVYSVPLGKVSSRSRLLSSAVPPTVPEMQTKRAVSLSMKNMPLRGTASKVAPKSRVRSRRSQMSPTPWSLGL